MSIRTSYWLSEGVAGNPQENSSAALSVTVVICAYTLERWNLLQESVKSVQNQRHLPAELIICIDHNDALLKVAREEWATPEGRLPIRVVENRFDGHSGSARNTAIELAEGHIVAFLDDDAAAEPDWLSRLVDAYASSSVMAVGGRPLPRFETACPIWFPKDFYWILGCAYAGLPEYRAPVRHLIGTTSSARREALIEIGGYHSDTHDDMDMCHRIAHRYGQSSVVYDPSVVVTHFVPSSRVTWTYFRKRSYCANRDKAIALADMGDSGNLGAEREFVRLLVLRAARLAARGITEHSPEKLAQAMCSLVGLALAGLGFVDGWLRLRSGRYEASLTRGLERYAPDPAP